MTERERLIKLLDERIAIQECSFSPDKPLTTDSLADYLLKHGVIVPPCKVGDTVYHVGVGKIFKSTIAKITRYRDRTIYESSAIAFEDSAIGKAVFLTREEAEATLA